jgi:predicted ester cyclase
MTPAELHRRWLIECVTEGNLELVDELFAPDHELEIVANTPLDIRDGRPIMRLAMMYRRAGPDVHVDIKDQITEGDRVVTRFEIAGFNHGPIGPIPPSHEYVLIGGVEIARVRDGQFVHTFLYLDLLGLMAQTGVLVLDPPAFHQPEPERAPIRES